MRIVGGTHRGRKLIAPKGLTTRPTPDRVREALFDILGPRVIGSSFLDAYAGTGAVGLEAASRGAGRVVFIESDRSSLAALRKNIAATGVPAVVLARDAAAAIPRLCAEGAGFDIVFLDPPYAEAGAALELAERFASKGLLAPEGLVILEHRYKNPPPAKERLFKFDERRYGDTGLSIYRPATPNDRKDE